MHGAKYWWYIMGHKTETRNHLRHFANNLGSWCEDKQKRTNNPTHGYMKDIEISERHWKCLNWKFKFGLEKITEFIPDESKMPNYVTAARRNSILDQQSHLRAQWIYQGGGVPHSATEQA